MEKAKNLAGCDIVEYNQQPNIGEHGPEGCQEEHPELTDPLRGGAYSRDADGNYDEEVEGRTAYDGEHSQPVLLLLVSQIQTGFHCG